MQTKSTVSDSAPDKAFLEVFGYILFPGRNIYFSKFPSF